MSVAKPKRPIEINIIFGPMVSMWDWLTLLGILLGLGFVPVALLLFLDITVSREVGRQVFNYTCPASWFTALFVWALFWAGKLDPETRKLIIVIVLPTIVISVVGAMFFRDHYPPFRNVGLAVGIAVTIWYCFLRLPPYYWSAFNQFRLRNLDRALHLLEKSIQARPKSYQAHQLRSMVHYMGMQMVEAEQDARAAIRLNPKSFSGQNMLGSALLLQGRYPEAKQAFTEALRLAPNYAINHYNLGQVHYRLGEYADAEKGLTIAARAGMPNAQTNLRAHYLLGRTLEALGDLTRAEKVYRKMVRFRHGLEKLADWLHDAPDHPEILQLRAEQADIERRLNALA